MMEWFRGLPYMEVPPKWMVYNWKSILNGWWFGGVVPYFRKPSGPKLLGGRWEWIPMKCWTDFFVEHEGRSPKGGLVLNTWWGPGAKSPTASKARILSVLLQVMVSENIRNQWPPFQEMLIALKNMFYWCLMFNYSILSIQYRLRMVANTFSIV